MRWYGNDEGNRLVMDAPDDLYELLERFERNRKAYLSGAYNETQLRREFLDPFFEVLGWDVFNRLGYAEAYKDVIHEDAIKVGGYTKAPDYCFRIGGTRKFFVEAKKPSVNIGEDVSPAFQLRRYAWSAKLPLSILTDFEELAVYDCRVKPVKIDKASSARIIYVTYEQYPKRWEDIASVFSRDAILQGSFDRYVETTKGKKGTAEVDGAFLNEIESWRDSLARNIALRNAGLSQRDMNFAVQAIIDRIIFLRMCEDRGIEEYGTLLSLVNGVGVYARLCELFVRADEKYNSGLFHFRDERGRDEPPDLLTPNLVVDDKPLKEIIKNLYYPDSPYEFAVLPADILGQVYEQFLGKVIRLTAGHRAVVEDKPEVKKAGGVFYTPTYIVDYIVENTVGRILEGKTPKQVTKIRILDPACGSGSFLIGAFQYLLDWHRDWFIEDGVDKHTKEIYQGFGGEWRLTTAEKKQILLNNIHGVDIDPQAVEVTKLSLLLKVLEGESDETISKQLKLFQERALPDLGDNIKCGNSLIGMDFYDNQQMTLLDEEERYRINAFNWNAEFAEVIQAGGFDAVIGNPPYINMLTLDKIQPPSIKAYWKDVFTSAAGAFDIYVLFVEQGMNLLRSQGYLSFIIPNKFLAAEYAKNFRKFILAETRFISLLDFSRVKVWTKGVYPVVPLFQKGRPFDRECEIDISAAVSRSLEGLQTLPPVPCSLLSEVPDNIWSFVTQPGTEIMFKALSSSKPLESIAEVCGSATVSEGAEYPNMLFETDGRLPAGNEARFIVSGNVYRYDTSWQTESIRFTHATYRSPMLKLEPPVPARRIKQARSKKILMSKVALEPRAFLDSSGIYAGGYTTYVLAADVSLEFITGVLNSRLMSFIYRTLYDALAMAGGYLYFQPPQVRRLPICKVDLSDARQLVLYQNINDLVIHMLELHRQYHDAKIPSDKTSVQRQIETTDKQIDLLVYELYDLTDDEIRIVEQATNADE